MVPEVISHGFTQTLKLQTLWRFSHLHYKPLCSTAVNHHNFVMSHLQVIETIKKRPRKGSCYVLANYFWTVWQLCKVLRNVFILFFSHSFTSTLSHIASEYSEKSPGTSALFLFLFMSLYQTYITILERTWQMRGSYMIPQPYHTYCLYFCMISLLESESDIAQSCLTLCDPMDCSLPGFSVHGIFQARVLEWAAISFSRGSSWPRDGTWVSCIGDIWATRETLYIKSLYIITALAQSQTECSYVYFWPLYWTLHYMDVLNCIIFIIGLLRWFGDWRTCLQCRRHQRYRLDSWVRKFPPEEDTAACSSILAWRIPWTEKPGRLQSTGLKASDMTLWSYWAQHCTAHIHD